MAQSTGNVHTYVVAEMACSHEGSTELARVIIDAAGTARADAIQFQIWTARDMVVPDHPDLEKLLAIELSRHDWSSLVDYARGRFPDMQIIACVYERGSADFAESIDVDAYKLHSADLSNPYLIRHVAAAGKRIDLSVGASTLEEIRTAVNWIQGTSDCEIWLMYGYQNFPTPVGAVHLGYMKTLRETFQLPIGYQDHTDADSNAAFWLPAVAVGIGVDSLEKHITHDRSKKGADHEAALNPDEFARFVEMVHRLDSAYGSEEPRDFSQEEIKYRKYSKKSLVAACDLPVGTEIADGDLLFMRTGALGLPPDQASRLVGRTTRRNIAAYELICEEDVT